MSVKFCLVLGVAPFCAVIVIGKLPLAVGVPLSRAVPSWLSLNVTPFGRVPTSVRAGVGKPAAVTVKVPALPTVNVALVPLVNPGGVADWKIANGEREVTLPQSVWLVVSTEVVTSTQAVPLL